MTWLPILALAVLAFLIVAFVFRLPKSGWAMFGAVLMFGLAGYALQGSPGMPAAPKSVASNDRGSGEAMVDARRALFDPAQPKPHYLTVSDGFARRGKYERAANILRSGLAENPAHGEGWLALANALVEHAEGQVTPASLYAYGKAEGALPGHPGPAYFLGFALIRSGQPMQARAVWSDLLESSPPDAPWRADLAERIAQLDELIARMQGARPQ
ncbi:MAG: cytochrome c biogenesis factor [Alphaproteobacteria bacterium]|nr:MAG: cytochrome c biogenesis factor [Alphaproteobacteria bacterium]